MPDPLAQTWSAAFDVPVDDLTAASDFFELGGDSVTAAVVAAEVGRRWGVDMPLSVFFEHGTLGEMRDWLAARATS